VGTFKVSCRISNVVDRARSVDIPQLRVDTGGEYTWGTAEVLE
jgi:hypothetical protein